MRGSWRLNRTATYRPSNFSGYHSLSFPFSWAAQPGACGPSLCWDMVLIPASSLQLIWTSCRWGYIIIWHPPTSCECHNSHSIQCFHSQGCPLISGTGCTSYLHRCIYSFDSLARSKVNMQKSPFLLDQACCFHSPYAKWYVIQAFSIPSNFYLKLLLKKKKKSDRN